MNCTETHRGFEITFDFDYKKVNAIKKIKGTYFMDQKKIWVIPYAQRKDCDRFIKKFTKESAFKHIREVVGTICPLPELKINIPLKKELFPYQTNGVAYNLIHKRVIVADAPGVGKTSQAIATILAAKAFPCLIVCPSTIKENWKREWEMWTDERPIIMRDKVKTSWKTYYDVGMSNIFITNYESLTKYFIESIKTPPDSSLKLKDITFRPSISIFKSIIIDESHRAKEGTARATKILIGLANGKEYRLLLTGTPVVNKPEDLITQLYILGKLKSITDHLPDLIDKKTGKPMPYKMFRDRYCDGKDKASNLKELNYRLTMNSFYRREKNEVLKDLPERMQQVLICDITNREEYQKAQDNFVKYLKEVKMCTDEQIKTKMRGEVMVRIGVLKQISARGKIEAVKEYIEEITDAGEKVGVFMNLREIAAELKSIFPKAVSISGSVTMQERQANIDAFQRNKDVLISLIGIKAGGVGLTLTAASRCAFIEFPWHDADCDQCISRFDRIGQQFSVMATFFLGRNTIDEWCYDLIQQKKSIAQAITGDTYIIQDKFIDDLLNLFNKKV